MINIGPIELWNWFSESTLVREIVSVEGIVESLKGVAHELYVIGEQVERWQQSAAQFHDSKDLKNTMTLIASKIKKGDTVLLSPGTSSFGEFKNYKERGDVFEVLARDMLREAAH